MHSDTVIAPTVILTTASTSTIQVQTVPAQISAERENLAAIAWSEALFRQAKSSDRDAARFLCGMFA